MRRRAFLGTLAASVALWPRNVLPQTPPRRALIGFLGVSPKTTIARYYSAFPLGMRELGYVEGRDYAIEERYADGDFAPLPRLAQELVRLNPDVIVAGSTPSTLAAKQATAGIPIVGLLLTDPVGLGLVASEARPGTNVTGILVRVEGLLGKHLEIARDLVPGASKIGALVDTSNPTNVIQGREAQAAAAKLGVSWAPIDVRTADQIGPAFQTFVRERADIVIVFTDAVFNTARRQIAAFALASRLPTVYSDRDTVEVGGLISYGVNRYEIFRRAAYYVDRILKGEKPADLPVEFPTKLEMVINLATAKALGITVPATLLAQAADVIE